MKISAKNYAAALVESLEAGAAPGKLAGKFWQLLNKNKQYRDLPRILAALDYEYARKKNMVAAAVYSADPLSENEIANICKKLKARFGKNVMVNNVVKGSLTTGIIVKVDDKQIDLSLDGKIKRLKNKINQSPNER